MFGGPALAQIEGDLRYDLERDEGTSTSSGAADSTVSTQTIVGTEAEVITSPSSLSWSGDPANVTDQQVTITNGGTLSSLGTVSLSTSGSFQITANSCSSLRSGQSCQFRVRPNNGATGTFNGSVNITTQSGKSGTVALSANLVPPRPPVENVTNCEFNGGNIWRWRDASCTFTVPVTNTYTFYGVSIANPQYNFPIGYLYFFDQTGQSQGRVLLSHQGGCGNGATRWTHRACQYAHTIRQIQLPPGTYTTRWYNGSYRNRRDFSYLCVQGYSGTKQEVVAAGFGSWPNGENRSTRRCTM